MSVSLPGFRWAAGLSHLAVAIAVPLISARGLALEIPDVFRDPLGAQPQVLDRGPILAGDEKSVVCPPAIDLAQPLDLADAVDLALCLNPQVQTTWATIKIRAAELGEARGAYLPTLAGSASRLNTRTKYPAAPDSNRAMTGNTGSANLTWRLLDFGSRSANLEAAARNLEAALAAQDAALQRLLASVVGAYFDVASAQAVLDARRAARELAQRTLGTTERRERKGVAARSDVLQAGAALAKMDLAERRAEGEYRKAMSVLVYVMGLPTSTAIHLPESPNVIVVDVLRELDVWVKEASARHPAILAARAQRDAVRAKVDAVRAEGLPVLDFVSNYYRNGYPNQGVQLNQMNSTTAGLTVTIPLFEGFVRTYKVRQIEGQVEQSAAQAQDVEYQVLSEVVKAYADARSSLANLESSARLLSAAEESLRSSERRYAAGAADVLELVSIQSALADAQQERAHCLAEWRSAKLKLMASAGVLGRRVLRDDIISIEGDRPRRVAFE